MKEASGAALCSSPSPALGYGIVFALRRDMAVALGRGRSFYSYPYWLAYGGGDSSTVYIWLDHQRTRYGFDYGSPWSLAGLIHALKGDIVFASCPGPIPARGCSGCPHRPSGVGAIFII